MACNNHRPWNFVTGTLGNLLPVDPVKGDEPGILEVLLSFSSWVRTLAWFYPSSPYSNYAHLNSEPAFPWSLAIANSLDSESIILPSSLFMLPIPS
jgi:hypothetical protein